MPFYISKQILCFCDHCRNHEMTHDWVCMQFLYSLSSFIHFRKWAYAIKNFLLSVPTKSFEWLRLLGAKETAVHLNRKKKHKKTGKCCTNPLDIEWKRKIVLVAMWQRISFHALFRHSITITVPVLPSSGVALLAASFFSFLLYMRILKFVCKQEVVKIFLIFNGFVFAVSVLLYQFVVYLFTLYQYFV